MTYDFRHTCYTLSAHKSSQLPPDEGAEVAFAGRSNAGKSSAINTITGRNGLAHTSKTPGRTQMINYFQVTGDRWLVDLPGYGYAKVPLATKHHWQQVLGHYLQTRQALRGLMLMMDIRHPLTELDHQIVLWAQASDLPLHILLTKADKLSRGQAGTALLQVRQRLATLYPAATVQTFSSLKRQGVDDARQVLEDWLELGNGDAAGDQALEDGKV